MMLRIAALSLEKVTLLPGSAKDQKDYCREPATNLSAMQTLTDPVATLVLRIRRSRKKAREAAVAEVVALLREVGGRPLRGGPLSEVSGVAWVGVDEGSVSVLAERLQRLGYVQSIDLVRPTEQVDDPEGAYTQARWKRRDVTLVPIYFESDEILRQEAPDRRAFLLECGDGVVRRIHGYRGGRGDLERRALPVADARLLVNLTGQPADGCLLDPFAGAGGVVIQARQAGWTTWSVDLDPALRFGLAEVADLNVIGDAAALPLATGSVEAVATEPPYHPKVRDVVCASIAEIARVLKPGGRAALLAGADQAGAIRDAATRSGLTLELDTAIDRKGTDVNCFCWRR